MNTEKQVPRVIAAILLVLMLAALIVGRGFHL
jgi:hypothetical protein